MADNDYATALLVEKIAKSPFKDNTLIFIIEDDAQNGPDHVDAHRSIAYVVGPYVKQKALISKRYTTVSMVRTIEDILGIEPLGITDGLAEPMSDVFEYQAKPWDYKAIVPKCCVLPNYRCPRKPRRTSCRRASVASHLRNPEATWRGGKTRWPGRISRQKTSSTSRASTALCGRGSRTVRPIRRYVTATTCEKIARHCCAGRWSDAIERSSSGVSAG